jgi:hypothetical protein
MDPNVREALDRLAALYGTKDRAATIAILTLAGKDLPD